MATKITGTHVLATVVISALTVAVMAKTGVIQKLS